MKVYGPFSRREPTSEKDLKLASIGIWFSGTEDGRCWYDIVKEINKTVPRKFVVLVDKDNNVLQWSKSPDGMFPEEGNRVFLVAQEPKDVYGAGWKFIAGKFTKDYTIENQAMGDMKAEAMSLATATIQTLTDLIEMGEDTEANQEKLTVWKEYRIQVYKTDATKGIVELPPKPE